MFAVLISSSSLVRTALQHRYLFTITKNAKVLCRIKITLKSIELHENIKHKLAQQKTKLQTYYIILLNTFW